MQHKNTPENLRLFLTTEDQLRSVVSECINEVFQERSSTQSNILPEIIDTKELLLRLGLSEPTVIRYRQKGVIPFLQVGSAIRYDYQKVLDALEKKKGNRK